MMVRCLSLASEPQKRPPNLHVFIFELCDPKIFSACAQLFGTECVLVELAEELSHLFRAQSKEPYFCSLERPFGFDV